jgi:predicted secreted protein
MPTVAMGTTIKKTAGTSIAGLTSISGLELSSETIDTTTLDTTGNNGFRTFVSSFKDAGECSISGFFEYASHSTILADFMDNSVDEYVITFPGGTTWTFDACVTGFTTGADLEDLISFEATLKVSGQPVLATTP